MKYNLVLAAVFLGSLLAFAPSGVAAAGTIPGGHQVSVINKTAGFVFLANATSINGSVAYNLIGIGGNDTFILAAGNGSFSFVATGLGSNRFNLTSGGGNSTFSLSSGANSNFTIFEQNRNGTLDANGAPISAMQTFAITGGNSCSLNETSTGPLGNALWSVNLGTNSTVSLGSVFAGNQTVINILT